MLPNNDVDDENNGDDGDADADNDDGDNADGVQFLCPIRNTLPPDSQNRFTSITISSVLLCCQSAFPLKSGVKG